MKVYVLYVVTTENGYIVGAYSSRALAEDAGRRLEDDEDWEVQELEIDTD